MALDLTTVTGTLYDVEGNLAPGIPVYVSKVIKAGLLVSTTPEVVATSDQLGVVTFTVPRNSTAYIGGNFLIGGTEPSIYEGGIRVKVSPFVIPDAPTATLESLGAAVSVPTQGLTVKANGSALAHLIGTLDFGADFAVTESPTGEANISLAAPYVPPAIVAAFGNLANAVGWLHNDGSGVLAYSTPTKSNVGLGNVDNTSDANKPVSTAQQTALNLKADLSNVALLNAANAFTVSDVAALAIGPNGNTNPVLRVNTSVASPDGISISGGAVGTGTTIAALSSGSNSSITLTPKGLGQLFTVDGDIPTPSYSFSSNHGTGMWGGGFIGFSVVGVASHVETATIFRLPSNSTLGWASGTANATNTDTFLTRRAAANINYGDADAAIPVNQKVSTQGSRSGTDSNVAGANLTIGSGIGTGNSTPSKLFLQSPVAVGSGTGAQTQTTGLTIFKGTAQFTGYTVATLPAGAIGMTAYVTDGDASLAWGATVINSGAGATKYLVWFNNTAWTVVGK